MLCSLLGNISGSSGTPTRSRNHARALGSRIQLGAVSLKRNQTVEVPSGLPGPPHEMENPCCSLAAPVNIQPCCVQCPEHVLEADLLLKSTGVITRSPSSEYTPQTIFSLFSTNSSSSTQQETSSAYESEEHLDRGVSGDLVICFPDVRCLLNGVIGILGVCELTTAPCVCV